MADFAYTLGSTGNRTALAETVNNTSRNYNWAYDPLYRLTQEAVGGATVGTVNYTYDAVGNRTSRSSASSLGLSAQSSTFTANDLLTSDGYDNDGNTTSSSSVSYQYDALDHLTNVNNGAIVLAYDGDGNRARKTVGGTSTYYLLDDRNPSGYVQVLEEWTTTAANTTNLSRVYNYGPNLISQTQPGNGTYYFVWDGHGSTRALTDTSYHILNSFTFDAFGSLIASNSTPQTAYLYCGQQFDADLGLSYNRARYLNLNSGRFWTMDTDEGDNEDPLSLPKYLYCSANPVNMTDPEGHDGDLGSLAIAGSVSVGLDAAVLAPLAGAIPATEGTVIAATATEAAEATVATETAAAAAAEAEEGSAFIQTAKATLRQAGTTVKGIIEQAKKLLNKAKDDPIKVVPMPRSIIPDIAKGIAAYQLTHPSSVRLTRCSSLQAAQNRAKSLAGYAAAGSGLSLDEYPFASSIQGGAGASVVPVPFWQNCVQVGIIGACYRIEKIEPGTPFFVVITP